ncbi:MAG TPA: protein kinase, partial [Candidatus Obscuribacterales bacterium]
SGDVFQGQWKSTYVALKSIPQVKPQRLANELRMWRLSHESVVDFLGISLRESELFLVMELAPFGNLQEHCHHNKLTMRTRLDAIKQVMSFGLTLRSLQDWTTCMARQLSMGTWPYETFSFLVET